MKACPYCNNTEGYMTKNVQRYAQYYNFNDEIIDAGDIYAVRGGMVKYCSVCERPLGYTNKTNKEMSKGER